ncbi:carbohydrate kinase [Armillaria solidipes]|uniref:Gluconokinase n=1 Tax=Armillaria solidipes TaxID=1076256 RepID=A0A2H3BV91_9AGAR|nr:carbohydrate kinase [Armillaria solidipes]
MALSMEQPVIIIAMGVSGTGKSTLGSALAESLGLPFIDGDDLHPPANIAKMSSGQPLTDADREPWLALIRETGVEKVPVVMACSALKRHYRDILRGKDGEKAPRTYFVYIKGSREVLLDRMQKRQGHFFKVDMLDSQFEALESPEGEEGVVTVPLEESTEVQVAKAKEELLSMVVDN